jgi:hypothetical protein
VSGFRCQRGAGSRRDPSSLAVGETYGFDPPEFANPAGVEYEHMISVRRDSTPSGSQSLMSYRFLPVGSTYG